MNDMTREPSMEEILSSIRRVIARDETQRQRGGVHDAAGPGFAALSPADSLADLGDSAGDRHSEPHDAAHDEDDVLELTEYSPVSDHDAANEISDTEHAEPLAAADTGAAPAADPVTSVHETVTDIPAMKPTITTTARPAPSAPLIDAAPAAASRQSLDALARALTPEEAATEPGGDTSVNALVEAALRPMLKQWLDANLPTVVEKLVAAEIARIAESRA